MLSVLDLPLSYLINPIQAHVALTLKDDRVLRNVAVRIAIKACFV